MDEILIQQLALKCIIGVHNWERSSAQKLLVSLRISSSTSQAAAQDRLSATVDYAAVCRLAEQIARDGNFRLVETLAEAIAAAILQLQGVRRVSVKIMKPAAVRNTAAVGVSIVRPDE